MNKDYFLNEEGQPINVVQERGYNESDVMSQKSITEEFDKYDIFINNMSYNEIEINSLKKHFAKKLDINGDLESTGVEYYVTDYIPVQPLLTNIEYSLRCNDGDSLLIAAYDIDKKHIDDNDVENNHYTWKSGKWSAGVNTHYIRVSFAVLEDGMSTFNVTGFTDKFINQIKSCIKECDKSVLTILGAPTEFGFSTDSNLIRSDYRSTFGIGRIKAIDLSASSPAIVFYNKLYSVISTHTVDELKNGLEVPLNACFYIISSYSHSYNPVAFENFKFEEYYYGNRMSDTVLSSSIEIYNKKHECMVGCYYFGGWSNTCIPNGHITNLLIDEYRDRKPVWGWVNHGGYSADAWLISPNISLPSVANLTLTINHIALFHTDKDQLTLYIKRSTETDWTPLDMSLPDAYKAVSTNTPINIAPYAGSNVQIAFRYKNKEGVIPIWEIKSIEILSNSNIVFSRLFTDSAQCDFNSTDNLIWSATYDEEYNVGMKGDSYDIRNSEHIEKEIQLAKYNGIDYFVIDWYYFDDSSSININNIEKAYNHRALYAFMKACNKYQMNFCLCICNHEGFEIKGEENWKRTLDFISDNYFSDSQYLRVDNKPVLFVYEPTCTQGFISNLKDYTISNLDLKGIIWIALGAYVAGYDYFSWYSIVPTTEGIPEKRAFREIVDFTLNEAWSPETTFSPTIKIPLLTCGWDRRPWFPSGDIGFNWYVPDLQEWKRFLRAAFQTVKRTIPIGFRTILIYAWNENGEGAYLMPTDGDKSASLLRAIKEIKSEENME